MATATFDKPLNEDLAKLESHLDDIGIVVDGNKTSYASGAAQGQYVVLKNSSIVDSGSDMLADGLYTAAKAIPYNTVIDKTYLTQCPGGGLNALNSKLMTITKWDCQSNENWSANSWSHISGGGIPSNKIPSGKTVSANLIGIFAVSTVSGWTRIVANLRNTTDNNIALSIYSSAAGNTNSIKFTALWL